MDALSLYSVARDLELLGQRLRRRKQDEAARIVDSASSKLYEMYDRENAVQASVESK